MSDEAIGIIPGEPGPGWQFTPWPPAEGQITEAQQRDVRERAMVIATYVSPEMDAFSFESGDDEYMARLIKTADRIADWIRDGV